MRKNRLKSIQRDIIQELQKIHPGSTVVFSPESKADLKRMLRNHFEEE